MDQRDLKVSFNKGGSGSISASIRLPISWIKELGIDQDNRDVEVYFNEDQIIIKKMNTEQK